MQQLLRLLLVATSHQDSPEIGSDLTVTYSRLHTNCREGNRY